MRTEHIPAATVARLPIYVYGLRALVVQGVVRTSSQKLAETTGVEASQIRRDLSYLGAFGTPGLGYSVRDLLTEISRCLGLTRTWSVALVGCSGLGAHLTEYPGVIDGNFRLAAVFDDRKGEEATGLEELPVYPLSSVPEVVSGRAIEMAILAVSADSAQPLADQLAGAGVTSILNLTPTPLTMSSGIVVRNVDLGAELQILAFHETMRRESDNTQPGQKRETPSVSDEVAGRN